jgi:hypothetical protein
MHLSAKFRGMGSVVRHWAPAAGRCSMRMFGECQICPWLFRKRPPSPDPLVITGAKRSLMEMQSALARRLRGDSLDAWAQSADGADPGGNRLWCLVDAGQGRHAEPEDYEPRVLDCANMGSSASTSTLAGGSGTRTRDTPRSRSRGQPLTAGLGAMRSRGQPVGIGPTALFAAARRCCLMSQGVTVQSLQLRLSEPSVALWR